MYLINHVGAEIFTIGWISECLYTPCWKEKLEDAKEVIRSRKLKKDRQHKSQKKKDKRTNLQIITQTEDRLTRTPIKTGMTSGAPEE